MNTNNKLSVDSLNNNINTFKDIITIPQIVNSQFTNIPADNSSNSNSSINSSNNSRNNNSSNNNSSNNNNNSNNSNNLSVSITLSQIDIKNKKNKLLTIDKIIVNHENVISSPFLKESTSIINLVSPTFKKQLTVKETNANEFQFDIYGNDQSLLTTIKSSFQIKKILIDEMFGNISWSPCEEYLVFVGEPLINHSNLSFFSSNNSGGIGRNDNTGLNEIPTIGDQFIYKENWGESYSNIYSPTLFIIDIKKESIFAIDSLPTEKISPAQPIWTPCGSGIVFVGYDCEQRKMGLKLCLNRKSSIYHMDFNLYRNNKNQLQKDNDQHQTQQHQQFNISTSQPIIIENLIDKQGSYRSPRFSPDGKALVFLGFDEIIFNHNSCCKIFKIQWNKRIEQKLTIVEILMVYRNFSDEFTGVYCSSLPIATFIGNDQIVYSDNIRSLRKIISFNINSKQLSIINTNGITDSKDCPKNHYIYQVDHREKLALCKISSPNQPPSIHLLQFNQEGTQVIKNISLYQPSLNNQQTMLLSSFSYSIHNVPTLLNAQTLKSFEMIYLKNQSNHQKKPTILFIHGGFHMCMDLEYSFSLTYFASLGYNIIIPNYRGSTGFGRDFLISLVGQISQMDVDDCIQCLSYSCEKVDPNGIDLNRLSIIGGSHGGSIGAILSSINNLNIKTAILRNPVIDQASQALVTDIPDWAMYKCGISTDDQSLFKFKSIPTLKQIEVMKNLSPIRYIENINIPILLLLGENDKRVPSTTQGLVLYNSLKERNITTKCIMYPNNGHALDSIESRLDQWINISNWLCRFG